MAGRGTAIITTSSLNATNTLVYRRSNTSLRERQVEVYGCIHPLIGHQYNTVTVNSR